MVGAKNQEKLERGSREGGLGSRFVIRYPYIVTRRFCCSQNDRNRGAGRFAVSLLEATGIVR